MERKGARWRSKGFYGDPNTSSRIHSWQLLKDLYGRSSLPWLVAGDFNEILNGNEKVGGATRPLWQITQFREAVEACELEDLKVIAPLMTWWGGNAGDVVYERLDMGLANNSWISRFLEPFEEHFFSTCSDHLPVFIDIGGEELRQRTRHRSFRCENMWLKHKECESIVKTAWSDPRSSTFSEVTGKIGRCGDLLGHWNNEIFGNVRRNISRLKRVLADFNDESQPEFKQYWEELRAERDKEETMWRLRAKTLLLKEGGRNTSYFHAVASRRKRNHAIHKIKDIHGTWQHRDEMMEDVFL